MARSDGSRRARTRRGLERDGTRAVDQCGGHRSRLDATLSALRRSAVERVGDLPTVCLAACSDGADGARGTPDHLPCTQPARRSYFWASDGFTYPRLRTFFRSGLTLR